MKIPRFPDDFVVRHADGGASYWHWHPDMPPEYDGTWPVDQHPPPWTGGLMISSDDSVQAELVEGEMIVVSWAVNEEDGPHVVCSPTPKSVQLAVEAVLGRVRREREVSARVE